MNTVKTYQPRNLKHLLAKANIIVQSLIVNIVLLTASASFAQGIPQTPTMAGQSPIVGAWQTTVNLGQGVPPATGLFTANPDGSYREEMKIQGKPAAFWEGRYTLSPDGTLTQTETNKSPQICINGRCMPNDGPSTTTGKVRFQGANTFIISLQDPATGQTNSLTWQRVSGASPAQNPTGQFPTNPGQNPSGQFPTTPGSSQNPLGQTNQVNWTGAYTDGQLKLVLQEQAGIVNGLIELGGNRYQLQAQGDANNLRGSFQTQQGQQFELSIAKANGGVVLTTGGKTYNLQAVPTNTPANPLGN